MCDGSPGGAIIPRRGMTYLLIKPVKVCGAVAERLRHRSRSYAKSSEFEPSFGHQC